MIAHRLFRIGGLVLAALLWVVACGRKESAAPDAGSLAAPAVTPVYVRDLSRIQAQYADPQIPARMQRGSEVEIRFVATNAGDETWPSQGDLPVRFGYHWANPSLRGGDWQSIIWDDGHRALLPSDVAPKASVPLTLKVQVPHVPSEGYKLIVAPLLEGPAGGWTTTVPLVTTIEVF
jgi:hypothetical protein